MSELGFCPWCKSEKLGRVFWFGFVCADCEPTFEPDSEELSVSESHESYNNITRGK